MDGVDQHNIMQNGKMIKKPLYAEKEDEKTVKLYCRPQNKWHIPVRHRNKIQRIHTLKYAY